MLCFSLDAAVIVLTETVVTGRSGARLCTRTCDFGGMRCVPSYLAVVQELDDASWISDCLRHYADAVI